jgi:multicomponent Na+:H+ antiporter subunit E
MQKTLLLHIIISIGSYLGLLFLAGFSLSGFEHLILFSSILLVLWALTYLFYRPYFNTFKTGINLAFYFLKELIVSNFKMIYFILSSGHKFKPAILELPLSLKSDYSITLLANLITLTPGTITLEISKDKKYLYFHIINVPNENLEEAKQKIKDGFEKRIINISS